MFKFDIYFRNIEVINYFFIRKKSLNSFSDMVSYHIYALQEKCKNMVMRFQSPLVYFETSLNSCL